MMHEDCKVCGELLAASVLTALDPEDERALATHLQRCIDCRSEMGAWENTAALLALDAQPLEPRALIREQILQRVAAAESQLNNSANARLDSSQDVGYYEPSSRREDSVIAFQRSPQNVWASLGSFGAIAAALVFVALIISLLLLWQQNSTSHRELTRLSNQITETQAQLDRERAIIALLTSPDARMAKLAGTNIAPGAHAMLAYDKSGHAMLMAKGLPAAPAGMAYQLWYIKDNKKMPGKVFTTDAAGNGTLEDQVPASAREAAVFAVTLEPNTGVTAPTGSIYLVSAS